MSAASSASIDPVTGERVLEPTTRRVTLAVMSTTRLCVTLAASLSEPAS